MTTFYGWGSTDSRLQSHYEDNLFSSTKYLKGPGTYLIDLGWIRGRIELGATQWF